MEASTRSPIIRSTYTILAHQLRKRYKSMEHAMRRLFPVLIRELTYVARECVKWTLVGLGCLVGMWFLTVGVPRLAAVINGLAPAHVIHPVATQLDAPHHLTNSR